MKRKNFIKIRAHANNKPPRVKRAAQKTNRFNKYINAAKIADIPNPAMMDHFRKKRCLRRAARPPMPGSR